MNFAYHLPKLWTDRFTHVNSKQRNLSFSFQWTLEPGYPALAFRAGLCLPTKVQSAGEEEEVGSHLHHSELRDEIGK